MPRVAAVEVDVATVPDVVPGARSALRGSGGLSADRLEHADVPKLATATRPAVAIARQTNDRIQRITPPMADGIHGITTPLRGTGPSMKGERRARREGCGRTAVVRP